jgi:signal recognition particle receptor subunit beta
VAQWRHADRTLCAKLVYYGPALGGKTTNLRSLHRITDPEGVETLLSVNTAADRTLFFDLLPFDLGTILGYKVALKVYTVPGQVRYDATRRVVLAGTDAVVFVADSSRTARGDNRASLENLRVNLHANGFDPDTLPIRYQFNKQDLPDAAAPEEVADWLGVDPDRGHAAVAIADRGVLEIFVGRWSRRISADSSSARSRLTWSAWPKAERRARWSISPLMSPRRFVSRVRACWSSRSRRASGSPTGSRPFRAAPSASSASATP